MAERKPFMYVKEKDACATCSEKTVDICGMDVKRWCLAIVALITTTTVFCALFILYAVRNGTATTCRLTYSDDATVSEKVMQTWASRDDWKLKVPTYDPWRRTCVCKGYEDIDPKALKLEDEVLVWIAPGDLVSLSNEAKIPALPVDFTNKYHGTYGEVDHVKVCMSHENVVDLWSLTDIEGDGRHCHVTKGDGSNTIERFYLGWDGALYCASNGCKCTYCYRDHCVPGMCQCVTKDWSKGCQTADLGDGYDCATAYDRDTMTCNAKHHGFVKDDSKAKGSICDCTAGKLTSKSCSPSDTIIS